MSYNQEACDRLSMNETVYIETSILGYLTARPSRDIVVAASIEITREW
jgi:hypothetical protein